MEKVGHMQEQMSNITREVETLGKNQKDTVEITTL